RRSSDFSRFYGGDIELIFDDVDGDRGDHRPDAADTAEFVHEQIGQLIDRTQHDQKVDVIASGGQMSRKHLRQFSEFFGDLRRGAIVDLNRDLEEDVVAVGAKVGHGDHA